MRLQTLILCTVLVSRPMFSRHKALTRPRLMLRSADQVRKRVTCIESAFRERTCTSL